MDLNKAKTKVCNMNKKKSLIDITNTSSKRQANKKKFKKQIKSSSDFKLSNLGFTNENINQQKSYYISIKENQLFSLASALKLNIEKIKCRYNVFKLKFKKFEEKQKLASFKITGMTPTPENQPKNNIDLSPISICESHSSTSSILNYLKSIEGYEYKGLSQKQLNLYELQRKLGSLYDENNEIIEQEFRCKEKKKKFNEERRDLVMKYGKIYEKKNQIISNQLFVKQLERKNTELKTVLYDLKGKFDKINVLKEINHKKNNFNKQKEQEINSVGIDIRKQKLIIHELEHNLSSKLESVHEKENYLKEVFSIKSQLLTRIDKMKNFDAKFSKTKESTIKALKNLSKLQMMSSSARTVSANK